MGDRCNFVHSTKATAAPATDDEPATESDQDKKPKKAKKDKVAPRILHMDLMPLLVLLLALFHKRRVAPFFPTKHLMLKSKILTIINVLEPWTKNNSLVIVTG